MTLVGCAIMRKASRKWPRLGTPSLIAICFAALFVADVILEGIIWLPLGFLSYPGGHWNLFAGAYHQYPVHEGIFSGALFTGLAALRYFTNDRGETVADRGLDMLVTYNIPVATLIASNPAPWPTSIQERSYFTDRVCGEGTTRLCPQPGVPTVSGGDVEIGPGGQSNVPPGVTVPDGYVPFIDTDR